MARTFNLLSDTEGLYAISYAGERIDLSVYEYNNWVSTNSTISVISTEFVNIKRYALRVAPSTSAAITLTLSGVQIAEENNGKVLSFNARIKAESPVVVDAQLSIDGEDIPDGHQTSLSGGRYNAVQSNIVTVPDNGEISYATIVLAITGHQALNVYMTMPNLIDDRAFYSNPFVYQSRNILPDFYWDIDSQQSFPTAPFHKLLDVLTSAAADAYDKYVELVPHDSYEIYSQSLLDGPWSRSELVDPNYVRDEYVNWLAQFTGTKIIRNIKNSSGSSLLHSTSEERAFIEWQLVSGQYGRGAGTRQAIISSAQQALTHTKDDTQSTYSVSVTPRYLDDPWKILVQTLENETSDADAGESSVSVLNAMEPARPLGYEIVHLTVDEFYMTLNDTTIGLIGQFPLAPVQSAPTSAPSDVSVDSVTSSTVTLAFTPLSATGDDAGGIIVNYEYALSTDGSTYGAYADYSPTDSPQAGQPPITISGLSGATTYWVKLKAKNEFGTGADESVPVSFTTS
jgi:hypothetical protein